MVLNSEENMDFSKIPPELRDEFKDLSPEAIAFLSQADVKPPTQKSKLASVAAALELAVNSEELSHDGLVEQPCGLLFAVLTYVNYLLLGKDDLDDWQENEQFKVITSTLEGLENKFLLKIYAHVLKTAQFKKTRGPNKRTEEKETSEDLFPEEEAPSKPAAKRRTRKTVKKA